MSALPLISKKPAFLFPSFATPPRPHCILQQSLSDLHTYIPYVLHVLYAKPSNCLAACDCMQHAMVMVMWVMAACLPLLSCRPLTQRISHLHARLYSHSLTVTLAPRPQNKAKLFCKLHQPSSTSASNGCKANSPPRLNSQPCPV